MNEAELDALMARLAEGDRSAFDPLYRALQPRALRLMQSRVDAASASDVTQSALLKVFARASEFTPGRPVLPWFYAVLSNELRGHLRRQQRWVVSEVEVRDARELEAQLLERELSRALELAIGELDRDSAEAIHAMLGGERPQIDPVAFRKRVSRAYARLRLYLGGPNAD